MNRATIDLKSNKPDRRIWEDTLPDSHPEIVRLVITQSAYNTTLYVTEWEIEHNADRIIEALDRRLDIFICRTTAKHVWLTIPGTTIQLCETCGEKQK